MLGPRYERDVGVLEQIQLGAVTMMKGLDFP